MCVLASVKFVVGWGESEPNTGSGNLSTTVGLNFFKKVFFTNERLDQNAKGSGGNICREWKRRSVSLRLPSVAVEEMAAPRPSLSFLPLPPPVIKRRQAAECDS